MSNRITLTLRDDVFKRAKMLAANSGRPVADLLTDAIDASLAPLGNPGKSRPPVRKLSDRKVLELADSMMVAKQDRRLSVLLGRQREGELTPPERVELMALMQVYQDGLLRKAQAIAEAVRRGLRGPPDP